MGAGAAADLQRDAPPTWGHGEREHRTLDGRERGGERGLAGVAVVVGQPQPVAVLRREHDEPGVRVREQRVGGAATAGQQGATAPSARSSRTAPAPSACRVNAMWRRSSGTPPSSIPVCSATRSSPRLTVEHAPDRRLLGAVPGEGQRRCAGRRHQPEARRPDRAQALLDRARRTGRQPHEVVPVAAVAHPAARRGAQGHELGEPVLTVGGRQQLGAWGGGGEVPDLGVRTALVGGQAGGQGSVGGEAGAAAGRSRRPTPPTDLELLLLGHVMRMAAGPAWIPSPRRQRAPLGGDRDSLRLSNPGSAGQVTVTVLSSVSTGLSRRPCAPPSGAG